jgi:hypothetical protein
MTTNFTSNASELPGARFSYIKWLAIIVAGTALIVAALFLILPKGDLLYRENGILEDASIVFWICSCIVSFAAAIRFPARSSRLISIWTGWISALAAMRELDLHIWLNPKKLGAYGVRYRIDWWLDGNVSFWLKLGWATLFVLAFYLTFNAPLKLRASLFKLLRRGDAFLGAFAAAIVFLMFGFVIDDILRPVQVIPLGTKQLFEETSEMIGAILFLFAILLHWRHPLNVRESSIADTANPTQASRSPQKA